MAMKAVAHTDGGNRSKIGACAAVIWRDDGMLFEVEQIFEGSVTNNFCEYEGVILALRNAYQLEIDDIQIYCDSELVVRQLNGVYGVKDSKIADLYDTTCDLAEAFKRVVIDHVPRELNTFPDLICNHAMDRHLSVVKIPGRPPKFKRVWSKKLDNQTDKLMAHRAALSPDWSAKPFAFLPEDSKAP